VSKNAKKQTLIVFYPATRHSPPGALFKTKGVTNRNTLGRRKAQGLGVGGWRSAALDVEGKTK
jgi:hypothetical protein